MTGSKDMFREVAELEEKARQLSEKASEKRREELLDQPLKDRLIYAAHARCICGRGLAYDPAAEGKDTPFKGPSQWECSGILTREGDTTLKHNRPFPFAFYEIKSDRQPSAHGATTRTPAEPDGEAQTSGERPRTEGV